jgi:hypothetical protein
VKTTAKTVWLLYDIFDNESSQTDNRDIAIDARDVRKLDVFEEYTSAIQIDNDTTVTTVVTKRF